MTTGLMVTRNEEHFIKYSLPPLRQLCDRIVVLDGSDDGTREYLEKFDNVYICREEDYPKMTCRERRQLLLDKGRTFDDPYYITIDADEIISEELASVFLYMKPYLNKCKGFSCNWWHTMEDMHHRLGWDTHQGFAFYDDGTNYTGCNQVHEDKLPHGFPEKHIGFYHLDAPLVHFGIFNEGLPHVKESYYLYLKCLDGAAPSEVNAENLNHYNRKFIKNFYATYPMSVDDSIVNIDGIEKSYLKKFLIVAPVDMKLLYQLDIWGVKGILRAFRCNVKDFNVRKIRHKRWKYPVGVIHAQIRLYQLGYLIKTLQIGYLILHGLKYFGWKAKGSQ